MLDYWAARRVHAARLQDEGYSLAVIAERLGVGQSRVMQMIYTVRIQREAARYRERQKAKRLRGQE